ncbi:MAG: hypothetical protein ACM3JP_00305 [Betaproteobacteria bacterium]
MYDATLAETVTIHGDGGDEIEAYLARPMNQGPLGGVSPVSHTFGLLQRHQIHFDVVRATLGSDPH